MKKKIEAIVNTTLSHLPNIYFHVRLEEEQKSYLGMSYFEKGRIELVINVPEQVKYNLKQVERITRHEYRHIQQAYWLYNKGGFELIAAVEEFCKKNFGYLQNPLEKDAFEFQGINNNIYPESHPIEKVMEKIYKMYIESINK